MDVQLRRGFAELLADRRGLLDAPHYPAQVAAIADAMVRAFLARAKGALPFELLQLPADVLVSHPREVRNRRRPQRHPSRHPA